MKNQGKWAVESDHFAYNGLRANLELIFYVTSLKKSPETQEADMYKK